MTAGSLTCIEMGASSGVRGDRMRAVLWAYSKAHVCNSAGRNYVINRSLTTVVRCGEAGRYWEIYDPSQ